MDFERKRRARIAVAQIGGDWVAGDCLYTNLGED